MLFALAIVIIAFFISCEVYLVARKRFSLFREYEIAKRTARNVSIRLQGNQTVPSIMNGFEVFVEDERIELKRGTRVYKFKVSDF